ncbi:MAG: DUF559 domain-containing protein, partial [Actinomycetota bacterium]|nr:DUF559 domain-containing protein [Actinomycetota bacterium]
PMPELQYEIRDQSGGVVARPDFVYPTEKVIIEGHSRLWHEGKAAQDEDLARHENLMRLGYRILYVTLIDVTQYPERTIARIRRMLDGADSRASSGAQMWSS